MRLKVRNVFIPVKSQGGLPIAAMHTAFSELWVHVDIASNAVLPDHIQKST